MQRKVTLWSLVIILAPLLYVVATLIFALLFREFGEVALLAPSTPQPTFTLESTEPIETVPATVVVIVPTSTATSLPTRRRRPPPQPRRLCHPPLQPRRLLRRRSSRR